MPGEQTVSLKEHFEKLLGEKEKGIRDSLTEREKALTLQATEYERRLDALNNENARILEAAKTYVTYGTLYTSFIALTAVVSIAVAVAAIYFR